MDECCLTSCMRGRFYQGPDADGARAAINIVVGMRALNRRCRDQRKCIDSKNPFLGTTAIRGLAAEPNSTTRSRIVRRFSVIPEGLNIVRVLQRIDQWPSVYLPYSFGQPRRNSPNAERL